MARSAAEAAAPRGGARRPVYFAFQGLFAAVLILVFVYEVPLREQWTSRFWILAGLLLASLAALRAVPDHALSQGWLQAAFFLADALILSLTLSWRGEESQLFLVYFLLIFGTALTRSARQSLAVGIAIALLFMFASWHPRLGFDSGFALRFQLLIVTTFLLSMLARDSQNSFQEQERRYQERLIQSERLATLGQVAGEVAHRIKGPLTTIAVNAEVLAHRHGRSKETLKELDEIRGEVEHCKDILKSLLDIGRIEEMDLRALDLRDALKLALATMESQFRGKGVTLKVAGLARPLPAIGDQSLLQEAVTALLQNSLEASKHGGVVSVSIGEELARNSWREPARAVYKIEVADGGCGIADEDLERIFQPFFTTKGATGDGLGLSAALRILQKHGGSVEAHSEGRGHGARFTLVLPKA